MDNREDRDERLLNSHKINLDVNLGKFDDFIRTISFNKPWVKALLLGVPSFYFGRKLAPTIASLTSPYLGKLDKRLGTEFDNMTAEDQRFLRNSAGALTALAVVAPTIISNIDFTGSKPWLGLNNFAPKTVEKEASFYTPTFKPASMPAYKAQGLLASHPKLTPLTRTATSSLVGTFPGNEQITGGSLINRAIATGYDAMAGGAVGFLAAHALGLPNPLVTAGIAAGINAFR